MIANVRLQVHQLKQNPVLREGIKKNELAVIGAYYEITSGVVDFFETDEELRIDAKTAALIGAKLAAPATAKAAAPASRQHAH